MVAVSTFRGAAAQSPGAEISCLYSRFVHSGVCGPDAPMGAEEAQDVPQGTRQKLSQEEHHDSLHLVEGLSAGARPVRAEVYLDRLIHLSPPVLAMRAHSLPIHLWRYQEISAQTLGLFGDTDVPQAVHAYHPPTFCYPLPEIPHRDAPGSENPLLQQMTPHHPGQEGRCGVFFRRQPFRAPVCERKVNRQVRKRRLGDEVVLHRLGSRLPPMQYRVKGYCDPCFLCSSLCSGSTRIDYQFPPS